MEHLIIHEPPQKILKHLVIVFSGWADAAEGATSAIKFLQRKLKSKSSQRLTQKIFTTFPKPDPIPPELETENVKFNGRPTNSPTCQTPAQILV